jgi:hypothetical protein
MPAKARLNINIDSNEISDSRYYSVEEVAGENWREGLEAIEDEWEWDN